MSIEEVWFLYKSNEEEKYRRYIVEYYGIPEEQFDRLEKFYTDILKSEFENKIKKG